MENLSPRSVWSHFATLCAIPRPSLHEAALREHLAAWAGARNIGAETDAVGNLILRKPASPGHEHRPGVILQAHLDMVCQANADTTHDFEHDPIQAVMRDGWVMAEKTTLGADNGIGVALALAALEADDLTHPPLEALFTINEESGMDGARGLAPGTLRGHALINLDTEEWGHFYLGCAGGVDVHARSTAQSGALPAGSVAYRIGITGLRGGHSGIDIALLRGNAILLLAEAWQRLTDGLDARLVALRGGSARNAIPREASAVIALPAGQAHALTNRAKALLDEWRARFADAEPSIALAVTAETPTPDMALMPDESWRVFDFIAHAPNGVARMSANFAGVVETSSNLGVVTLERDTFHTTFKVRSLDDRAANQLADRLADHAGKHGLLANKDGAYPGWTPNPSSGLLKLCQSVYETRYGRPASLQVIHAGLECGLLAASHPHLDMISFGPDIRGAHAPGERVEIASVERCWTLLRDILRTLAEAE